MTKPRMPRRLDHLVLPVPDLMVTRQRHEQLGFRVAAEARHPFGTENACVFFKDGTYLEPLAVASREECEAAALEGNVFVARDQAFRFRQGDNGLSALVVSSGNAEADHVRFGKAGISGGNCLSFSRPLKMPDGTESNASFKLAFTADLRSPDFFGFAVERVNMPLGGKGELEDHANGVTGISEVILSEPNPTDFQYYLQELADNREIEAHSFGMEVALDGSRINVMTPAGMAGWFGRKASTHARGLRGRAVVFAVRNLEETRQFLAKNTVKTRKLSGRLMVDDEPGQGVLYAFEEARA